MDYSKDENKNSFPLKFDIKGIDTSQAADEGIFILYAIFNQAT